MRSIDILGVRVDDVTFPEALALLERFIAERRPRIVTTPNPEFVMRARRDPDFARILASAGLAIPDGVGLLLAARLQGQPLRAHVRGTDLVLELAALSARRGYRWFLLGAAEGVAAAAAAALQRRYPGLQVAGSFAGDASPAGDPTTVAAVRAAGRVDVLLVAYGAPAQERWLDRNLARLDVPIGIGVGGVFNFLAGRSPRAPRWVRRLELEWLYRLLTEPWRWRRQLALPRFAALAAWDTLTTRRTAPSGGAAPPRRDDDATNLTRGGC